MSDISKLEVFKIISKRYTFREIAIEKCGLGEAVLDDSQIFNCLYGLFIKKLTHNEVWTHPTKTKLGLVLFTNAGENVNTILTAHSTSFVIECYIDGGPYDRIRRMSEKDDITTSTLVEIRSLRIDITFIFIYLWVLL